MAFLHAVKSSLLGTVIATFFVDGKLKSLWLTISGCGAYLCGFFEELKNPFLSLH